MSAATANSLWPTDLEPDLREPAPRAILRRQGHLLGQQTGNAIYGEVVSSDTKESALMRPQTVQFKHVLTLTSAYLGLSRPLVVVEHGLELYPAIVKSYAIDNPFGHARVTPEEVANSNELVAFLKKVFARPDVLQVIRSVIRQTRDLDDDSE